ncbi:hypothetical protein [Microbacterium foliorum]|uniref:hypothetical protein n=1 Tax=Microbacterium foliorum TaxID=104336 RepID=UPI001E0341E5|nr:hypothetical protein [Microbacterium foliorum]CAH0138997.1 hypothetical protein SRABI44_00426 [Microbacterium foliorum]CAH0222663.1 hypothetical protein SRABI03_02508 [Microbacterium foliorum]
MPDALMRVDTREDKYPSQAGDRCRGGDTEGSLDYANLRVRIIHEDDVINDALMEHPAAPPKTSSRDPGQSRMT